MADQNFRVKNGIDVGIGGTVITTSSSGNVGIGSTVPTSKLDVSGDGRFAGIVTATSFSGNASSATYATSSGIATYATSSGIATYATSSGIATYATSSGIATYATNAGIATALQNSRTFQITGDVVASAISFNGTGNVSLAATIQPNSVGLGTDTTGDYVQSVTGTSNQISVSATSGEGSTPTLSIPNQFTAPQDVTVTRDLQVNRNLNVTGNITIGGTTATLFSQTLSIFDPDIVLGFRTDAFGNDVSNDNTANHGGVALASTEGSPLVDLFIAGIETNPATYKKIMWFKSGTFTGLGTDAWLSNYAVGIGSTQFPTGTRLAAGNVQFTQNDLAVVRNINASGIVTASSFVGNLTGYASTAGIATYATSAGIATYATSAGISTYATSAGVSTSVIGGIASVTQLSVSGVSTLGITSATNLTAQQLNVSGLSTFAGITTHTAALFGTTGSFTGIVTASSFRGDGSQLTGLVPNTVSASTTTTPQFIGFLTTNSGITTSILASSTLVFIPSSGNLGIGTTNPLARLQVTGGAYVSGNLGIGTTNPTQSLHVQGNTLITGIATVNSNLVVNGNTLVADATNNRVGILTTTPIQPFQVGAAGTNVFVIDSIGEVGIGTTNPVYPLDVNGNMRIRSGLYDFNNQVGAAGSILISTGAGVSWTSSGGSSLSISTSTSSSPQFITFVSSASTTSIGITTSNLTFIPSSGNFGIGTSLPTARLSVASTTTGNSLMVVNDNLSDGTLFRVNDNSANVLMDVDANGTILFLNSGNVGIGTTLIAPTTKLQVIGTVSATTFSGNFTGVAATISTVQISSGIVTATSGVVTYYGDGSKLVGILTSGSAGGSTGQLQYNLGGVPSGANFFNYDNTTNRVGIGTSLPTARLSVASTTTGASLMVVNDNLSDGTLFRVTDNSANVLMDVDANGTVLFLNSGNVGIGTTLVSPTSKLQVAGNVLVSGVVTATTFSGNFTGTAVTATTGIITNIVGTAATISNVQVSSGIITASTGIVTYYGDGSKLSGVIALSNVSQGSAGQIQFNDSGPLGGANFFNYDKTTARVGIGTSLPTARLSVASTTTGNSLMVVNDNLSDGSVFRVNDNSANVLMDVDANGTILFLNSGNIGIGSTLIAPATKLQVIGTVTADTFSGNLTGTAVTVTTGIITNITSTNINITGITTTQILNVGTGGTIITTTLAGNVGVGTVTPTSRFNVTAPSSGNSLMVVNDNLSDGTLFRVNDSSANVLMDVDANGTTLFPSLTGTLSIGTYVAPTTLKLNVVGGAYISSSIGIGTTNPESKLTVNGAVQIQQDSGSNNRFILRGQPASSYRWNVDNFGSANEFRIFREDDATAANGSVAVSISTIGTLTATKFSGDGSLLTNLPGGSGVSQWVTTSVGIHTLSNVGIGTTNPTSKLHVVGNVLVSGVVTATTFIGALTGTATSLSGGAAGNIVYQSSPNATAFLTNGASGTVLQSNGVGNAPTWVAAAPSGAVSGITVRDSNNTIVGTSGSVTQLTFGTGLSVTGTTGAAGIATITLSSNIVGTALSISGISTFTNGPVLIGSATSTGTASQRLQVTGGAYVSGNLGVGNTNPQNTLDVGVGTIRLINKSSTGRFSQIYQDNELIFSNSSTNDDFSWTNGSGSRMRLYGAGNLVIPGTFTPTGTASQRLQVDGGAYVSGSVGIGTTNPVATLNVVPLTSTTIAGIFSGTTSTDMVRITQLGGGNALVVEDEANPDATPFVVRNNGSVGIGTNNPISPLHLQSTQPTIRFTESDASANSGTWINAVNDQEFYWQALTDLNSGGGHLFKMTRSAEQIQTFEGVNSGVTWFKIDNSIQGVGIGTTIPTSKLHVVGDGRFTGVVTATTFIGALTGTATTATKLETARTFQITGDVVASAISFDGTGNVSLAATIQPNSVALGSDTTGDYVSNITGTSNQISVSATSGEGSTPTLSIPNQFTAPQDATVTRDLQVNRNLNVTGNITIGGTTATLFSQTLSIFDPDIVLGFRTDGFGNDVSNDNTANHGGVALASTEGTPLVQLFIAGIETNPATYKKIMWFKSGTFSGLGTDAWLINYAVGIGSTQFPTGTRLAAGNVQFTQDDLAVVRNINASGIVTALTGNLTTGNIVTGIVTTLSGTTLNYTGIGTVATLNSTTGNLTTGNITTGIVTTLSGTTLNYTGIGTVATLNSTTGNITTGNITTGIVTTISGTTLNYTGIGTVATLNSTTGNITTGNITTGIVTTISGTTLNYTGIGTVATLNSTTANVTTGNITTGNITTGIVTTLSGTTLNYTGIGTVATLRGTNLNYTGIGTVGLLTATNLYVSGISTFSNGPVLIGRTSVTGTASQLLQVESGAYFNGDVGIGTTNPANGITHLDVYRSGASIQARNISTTGQSGVYASDADYFTSFKSVYISKVGTGVTGNIFSSIPNADLGLLAFQNTTNALIYTNGQSPLIFGTFSAERARINGLDGNFGIGTSNPFNAAANTYGLDVNRTSATIHARNAVTTGESGVWASDQDYFSTPSYKGVGIRKFGSVNAGNLFGSVPYADLGVLSFQNTTNALIYTNGGAPLVFATNSIEALRINTSQNVGIGTTTPTSKLHVVGDVRVIGVVTATTFVGALTGTATSTTNIPNLTGAITSNNTTTSLGSFTSAQLATALTDETGSGSAVFATSPTLVTPVLGVASATSIVVSSGSTFTNGPVLVGTTVLTGTASQPLQVTGGAYVSGSVGIGTTNPSSTLDVRATGATIRVQNPATSNYSVLLDANTSGPKISLGQNGDNVFVDFGAYVGINNLDTKARDLRIFSTAAPNAFTLKQDTGNIGINTTNPGATLNVVPTATSIAGLFSGTTSSDMVRITQLGTGNALVVEDSTNPDSSPFVVTGIGSVGIGTASPAFTADIAGDARVTSTNKMRFGGTAGTTNFYIQYNSTANSLDFVAG